MSLRDYDNPLTSFILGVVLIVISFGLVYLLAPKFFGIWGTAVPEKVEETTVYDNMVRIQQEAMQLAQQGKANEAKAKLEELLNTTQNETVYQQTRIALAAVLLDVNMPEAISLYKEIAADETTSPDIRAGAVEEMGLLYVIPLVKDPETLTKEIFSGEEVYTSMYDPDPAISPIRPYILLFEYANSISPRMLASAYVAAHNAHVLLLLQQDPSMAGTNGYNTVVTRLKERTTRNMNQLDERMKVAPTTDPYLARAYMLKGVANTYLFATGNLSQQDFDLAVKDFTQGIELTAQNSKNRYNAYPLDTYLATLAELAKSKPEIVKGAIQPLISELKNGNAWVADYLKNLPADSVAQASLAKIGTVVSELQPFISTAQ